MISYVNVSKLIKLNAAFSIYNKNNCDIIVGYTEPDDLAVIP